MPLSRHDGQTSHRKHSPYRVDKPYNKAYNNQYRVKAIKYQFAVKAAVQALNCSLPKTKKTMNKMFKLNIVLFVTLIGALTMLLLPSKAYAADCEDDGAYGQTCIYEKNFELEKRVRIQGDSTWKDKVINVKEGQVIEFRIIAKNVGEVDADDMEMKDILPDVLDKIGGSGLTEEWDDFDVDEERTFIIQARIKSVEFDRTDNFEKCVVNKAELRHEGDLVASDTATVCYGEKEIKELPKTGPTELMSIFGFASTGIGLFLKRRK